jgi:hypothetical protein
MTRPPAEPIATWAAHEIALDALGHSLEVLRAAGVEPLVVKGVALAYELYADVAERPLADVDLRVRPREFLRAARALRARGWAVDPTSRQLGSVGFLVGHGLVELESTVGPPGLCGLTVERMATRSRWRRLAGRLEFREPEVTDHAILLVVNAFKDKLLDCPPWSVDDLAAIVTHADFDRAAFVERVREARSQTLTWIVADWLVRERRCEAWRAIRDALGSAPLRPRYAKAFQSAVLRAPQSMAARMLARIGSDAPASRLWAVTATVIGTAVASFRPRADRGPRHAG